tara:strand:+ start:1002 stop:1202 length:201 start_codon:yes stop_codon:yes gene_type:complete
MLEAMAIQFLTKKIAELVMDEAQDLMSDHVAKVMEDVPEEIMEVIDVMVNNDESHEFNKFAKLING